MSGLGAMLLAVKGGHSRIVNDAIRLCSTEIEAAHSTVHHVPPHPTCTTMARCPYHTLRIFLRPQSWLIIIGLRCHTIMFACTFPTLFPRYQPAFPPSLRMMPLAVGGLNTHRCLTCTSMSFWSASAIA